MRMNTTEWWAGGQLSVKDGSPIAFVGPDVGSCPLYSAHVLTLLRHADNETYSALPTPSSDNSHRTLIEHYERLHQRHHSGDRADRGRGIGSTPNPRHGSGRHSMRVLRRQIN